MDVHDKSVSTALSSASPVTGDDMTNSSSSVTRKLTSPNPPLSSKSSPAASTLALRGDLGVSSSVTTAKMTPFFDDSDGSMRDDDDDLMMRRVKGKIGKEHNIDNALENHAMNDQLNNDNGNGNDKTKKASALDGQDTRQAMKLGEQKGNVKGNRVRSNGEHKASPINKARTINMASSPKNQLTSFINNSSSRLKKISDFPAMSLSESALGMTGKNVTAAATATVDDTADVGDAVANFGAEDKDDNAEKRRIDGAGNSDSSCNVISGNSSIASVVGDVDVIPVVTLAAVTVRDTTQVVRNILTTNSNDNLSMPAPVASSVSPVKSHSQTATSSVFPVKSHSQTSTSQSTLPTATTPSDTSDASTGLPPPCTSPPAVSSTHTNTFTTPRLIKTGAGGDGVDDDDDDDDDGDDDDDDDDGLHVVLQTTLSSSSSSVSPATASITHDIAATAAIAQGAQEVCTSHVIAGAVASNCCSSDPSVVVEEERQRHVELQVMTTLDPYSNT